MPRRWWAKETLYISPKKKKSRKKSQQQICYNQDNSLALGTTFGKSQSRTPFDVPTVAIMCSKKGGRVMDIRALCGISIDLCILHNSCFSDKLHQVIVGPAITSSLDSQQLWGGFSLVLFICFSFQDFFIYNFLNFWLKYNYMTSFSFFPPVPSMYPLFLLKLLTSFSWVSLLQMCVCVYLNINI